MRKICYASAPALPFGTAQIVPVTRLQKFLGTRVYLDLHVKVKSEWRDDDRLLDEMGLRGRETRR